MEYMEMKQKYSLVCNYSDKHLYNTKKGYTPYQLEYSPFLTYEHSCSYVNELSIYQGIS
ncbi:MAG: hypothetical protein K0Q65_1065 [Clostridia bacterium]|jgi:hypothetical protein|nr:hypothetical protein [Clostridia bacterium]